MAKTPPTPKAQFGYFVLLGTVPILAMSALTFMQVMPLPSWCGYAFLAVAMVDLVVAYFMMKG